MITPISFVLTTLLIAQAPAPAPQGDDPMARLEYMKSTVAPYNVRPDKPDAAAFPLQVEPIFRLNNPVTGVKDGAVFAWVNEVGRPEAAVQVFRMPKGSWLQEFTSLSTAPLIADIGSNGKWRPSSAGLEFQPIPDAPQPAATPEARLRQIRDLAKDFTAEDEFEGKTWSPLRQLPKPLARYGKPGSPIEDGVLIPFVLGTDPEAFLFIEARAGKSGLEWQYAFAPMTSFAVKGMLKGDEVWSLSKRNPYMGRTQPLFGIIYFKAE